MWRIMYVEKTESEKQAVRFVFRSLLCIADGKMGGDYL